MGLEAAKAVQAAAAAGLQARRGSCASMLDCDKSSEITDLALALWFKHQHPQRMPVPVKNQFQDTQKTIKGNQA